MGGLLPAGESMWHSVQRALDRAEKAETRVQVLEGELRWALTAIRVMGGERTDGKEWLAFQRAEAALASEGTPEEAKASHSEVMKNAPEEPLVHVIGHDGEMLCGSNDTQHYVADYLASKLATCSDCAARL
jgi:hypothetical protein